MTFHNPHLLWLLTLLLPAAGYYLYRLRKGGAALRISSVARSEEHTSELQSLQ